MMVFIGDTKQSAPNLTDASSPAKRKFYDGLVRFPCSYRRICQIIHSTELFLITLALCTKLSASLMCPLQCRSVTNAMKYRSIHNIDGGRIARHTCDSKRHRHRCWHISLNAHKSTEQPDEDDDDEKYIEDDIDSDEYLEHLISDAMNEEEKRISIPSRQTNTVVSANAASSTKDSTLEETKRMMEQQQQQIDLLMKLVQAQQQTTDTTKQGISTKKTQNTVNVTPLRVMIFIDGTWLYYSLHARKEERCTVTRKFGKGWQANYKVDWLALPRLICNEIDKQRGGQVSCFSIVHVFMIPLHVL